MRSDWSVDIVRNSPVWEEEAPSTLKGEVQTGQDEAKRQG